MANKQLICSLSILACLAAHLYMVTIAGGLAYHLSSRRKKELPSIEGPGHLPYFSMQYTPSKALGWGGYVENGSGARLPEIKSTSFYEELMWPWTSWVKSWFLHFLLYIVRQLRSPSMGGCEDSINTGNSILLQNRHCAQCAFIPWRFATTQWG